MGLISFFKDNIVDPIKDHVIDPVMDNVINPVMDNFVEPIVGMTPLGPILGIGGDDGGSGGDGGLSEADLEFLKQYVEYQMQSTAMHQMFSILGGSDEN